MEIEFTGRILEQILTATVIILIGLLIARLFYWIIKSQATKIVGLATAKTMAKFIQYLILGFAITIALLALFGVNATTIGIISGAIAFALTFGFQNIIQNVVGGVLIAIDGRVQLGDWIEVGDQPLQNGPAEVMDIGLTSITTRERYGRLYVIPSSYLVVHKVVNYSEIGCYNVNVPVNLPWSEDAERVREILLEEARQNPMVYPNVRPVQKENRARQAGKRRFSLARGDKVRLDFDESRFMPTVHIVKTENDKLMFMVSLWIESPINIRNVTTSYLMAITKRLRQEGIKLAPIFVRSDVPAPGAPGKLL
ncbi:MAG: mechanosensitive ion channel family protein [Methanomassiliicoccales archaeon]|nr:mechanosensitive ion channel family protein [Methanomassiliicoccales archaeon]